MDTVQQASAVFFAPVALAYLAACGGWLAADRAQPGRWPTGAAAPSNRPWIDLLLAVVGAAAILLVGAIYREGYLLPRAEGALGGLAWTANTLLIYSPIAVVLAARRQSPATIWLSAEALPRKLLVGALLGMMAVGIYHGARHEIGAWPATLVAALYPAKLVNFLPVFLEGVAVAFLFERLRWASNLAVALAVPALLFALAHVPGQWADERTLSVIAAFLVFNSLLVAAILFVVQRSRDVIWIGLVHYLMDVAIDAF